jgi:uncharacterized protein (TIGR02466 family)
MIFQPLFSSFIVAEKIDLDNQILSSICYKEKLKNKNNDDKTIYLDLNKKDLSLFFSTILKKFNKIHNFLNLKKNIKQKLSLSWCNINNNDYIDSPHFHSDAFLSAVYYVKADKNCGDIEFTSPIVSLPYIINNKHIEQFNTYNSYTWKVKPETGLLIIFPSWLTHFVHKNKSNTDRISIAVNSKPLINIK